MTSCKWRMSKPDPVLGYTTRRHLLLDFDDTTVHKTARLLDHIFKEYPEVGDAIIIISSVGSNSLNIHYNNFQRPYIKRDRLSLHVVFDNLIGYNKITRICETLAGLFILEKDYAEIRHFRGDLTLRVSPRVERAGIKPYPVLVMYKVNPHKNKKGKFILEYLRFLDIALSLGLPYLKTDNAAHNRRKRSNYSA